MKIRKAKPEDAEEIYKLRIQTLENINKKDMLKEQIQRISEKNSLKHIKERIKDIDCFVMTEKNKILGTIDLDNNEIKGLYVRFDSLGKGTGSKLLEFVENLAKKRKTKKLILNSTKTAINFYLKHGYKLTDKPFIMINGVKCEIYRMEKELI